MIIEMKPVVENAPAINKATKGSAGFDLAAYVEEPDGILKVYPGQEVRIRTGWAIHIKDPGVCGLILPRSGLGTKGLILSNTAGVIDSDYTGELFVCVWNRSPLVTFKITTGMRIAQLLFTPVLAPSFKLVKEFSETTDRGEGAFGSTG